MYCITYNLSFKHLYLNLLYTELHWRVGWQHRRNSVVTWYSHPPPGIISSQHTHSPENVTRIDFNADCWGLREHFYDGDIREWSLPCMVARLFRRLRRSPTTSQRSSTMRLTSSTMKYEHFLPQTSYNSYLDMISLQLLLFYGQPPLHSLWYIQRSIKL